MSATEIVIMIERKPGAPTVGIYSMEPPVFVIRDASVSHRELLVAYADVLKALRENYGVST